MTNFRESSMLWDHELWFCARSNSLLSPCPKSDQRLLKGACAATAATGWPQNVSLPKNALHPPLEWGAASDDLVKKQWKFLKPAAAFQKILGQVPICFLFIPRVCCSVQFPIFGPFCRVIKLNPIEKNQGGPWVSHHSAKNWRFFVISDQYPMSRIEKRKYDGSTSSHN